MLEENSCIHIVQRDELKLLKLNVAMREPISIHAANGTLAEVLSQTLGLESCVEWPSSAVWRMETCTGEYSSTVQRQRAIGEFSVFLGSRLPSCHFIP